MVERPANNRIGLLAAWGRLPVIIAQALCDAGYEVYGVGVKDHADPELARYCAAYTEAGLGRLGAGIRFFRRHQVGTVTMAGKVHKIKLFEKWTVLKHFPDWQAVRTFFDFWVTGSKDSRDDTMLLAVVAAFARFGIHFAPATDYAPELLVKHGILCGRTLTSKQQRDVQFGWQVAKQMGELDIGQSVVVKGRTILAVEAIEGTDECIRRAGKLCPSGGFTLVKVAKPQQDMRFDVPTIGVGTIETLAAAGAAVLAIEADKTIVLDQLDVIAAARQHGLTIIATEPEAADLQVA